MVHTFFPVPVSHTSFPSGLFPWSRDSIIPEVLDSAQKCSRERRHRFARSIHSIAIFRIGDIVELIGHDLSFVDLGGKYDTRSRWELVALKSSER